MYPAKDDTAEHWQLVALHGWGANAADLVGLAPYLQLPQFAMIFPDAPLPHPQVPGGRMWYAFPAGWDFRRPYDFQPQADLKASRQTLIAWLLALVQETQIPLERTVLAGFSQGGAMTLDVGWELPLAGQICLSGYRHGAVAAPKQPRPLAMVHGSFDPVVPIDYAHAAKTALEKSGQPVIFHEIQMGHEISPLAMGLISEFCEDLRQGR
ncbi:MAG: esterase [Leptolyngbyaceae cyanobacterium SM2_5_2]|nr:esterase [Leptolyngbyaceae cyanobacterium SM2_5_2]